MSVIRNAVVGGVTGLLAGAVIGMALGIVDFLAFGAYLELTTENPSAEGLGPLFSVYVGAIMGFWVGSPTGLVVGVVVGSYGGVRGAAMKSIVAGVSAGILVCAVLLGVGMFVPVLGTSSVAVGGGLTVGAGAIVGIATGIYVKRMDRNAYQAAEV